MFALTVHRMWSDFRPFYISIYIYVYILFILHNYIIQSHGIIQNMGNVIGATLPHMNEHCPKTSSEQKNGFGE